MYNDRARAVIYKDGKVLLMHRTRKGTIFYVLPGGTAEEGETPEITVMREIKEETSLETKLSKKLTTLSTKDGITHHIYECVYISGTPMIASDSPEKSDVDNIYDLVWIEPTQLPSLDMWPAEIKPFLVEYFSHTK